MQCNNFRSNGTQWPGRCRVAWRQDPLSPTPPGSATLAHKLQAYVSVGQLGSREEGNLRKCSQSALECSGSIFGVLSGALPRAPRFLRALSRALWEHFLSNSLMGSLGKGSLQKTFRKFPQNFCTLSWRNKT